MKKLIFLTLLFACVFCATSAVAQKRVSKLPEWAAKILRDSIPSIPENNKTIYKSYNEVSITTSRVSGKNFVSDGDGDVNLLKGNITTGKRISINSKKETFFIFINEEGEKYFFHYNYKGKTDYSTFSVYAKCVDGECNVFVVFHQSGKADLFFLVGKDKKFHTLKN